MEVRVLAKNLVKFVIVSSIFFVVSCASTPSYTWQYVVRSGEYYNPPATLYSQEKADSIIQNSAQNIEQYRQGGLIAKARKLSVDKEAIKIEWQWSETVREKTETQVNSQNKQGSSEVLPKGLIKGKKMKTLNAMNILLDSMDDDTQNNTETNVSYAERQVDKQDITVIPFEEIVLIKGPLVIAGDNEVIVNRRSTEATSQNGEKSKGDIFEIKNKDGQTYNLFFRDYDLNNNTLIWLKSREFIYLNIPNEYNRQKWLDAVYSEMRKHGLDLHPNWGIGHQRYDMTPVQKEESTVDHGVVIIGPMKGSSVPVQCRDIIQKINDTRIDKVADFDNYMMNSKRGKTYNMEIIRWSRTGGTVKKQTVIVPVTPK